MINLNNKEKQLQKSLLNLRDVELIETYCHEGFRIYEIRHGRQVWIGICSFNLTIPNKTKIIDSARKKVVSHIRSEIKLGRLGC